MSDALHFQSCSTYTVILRPPVKAPGRSRRWSAHCLDLDMGVSAQSMGAVKMRVATSIAAHLSLDAMFPPRQANPDPALWDVARTAQLVTCQTVETDVGPVEVHYLQPHEHWD